MEKQNHYSNSLFSYLGFYYKKMEMKIKRDFQSRTNLTKTTWYSKILSKCRRSAGSRPQWHVETSLVNRIKSIGFGNLLHDVGREPPERFVKAMDDAQKIMLDKNQYFIGDRKRLFRATLTVLKACKFPSQKFEPSTSAEAVEQIHKSSSSGFPNFRRKTHDLDVMQRVSDKVWNQGKFMDIIFNWPTTRNFRLQLRESRESEIKTKVRVMYPYPSILIFLEDRFIIPFVRHFTNVDTFYVIGRRGYQIGQRLKEVLFKSKNIVSLDVDNYDQTLVNEAIICAFWILRSQLKLRKFESIIFDNIVSYMCACPLVSRTKGKPISVFISHHGMPSGSGFTNMIDTLAHAIIVAYVYPDLFENDKILICGDDNICDLSNKDYPTLVKGYEDFKMTVSLEKTDFYFSWSKVKFLGFEWINGERFISYKLTLNQMCWHTTFMVDLDQFDREISRSASILLNGKNGASLFRKLFPDIINLLEMGVDIRFRYIYGSLPPDNVFEKTSSKYNFNESLQTHLEYGYAIR